MFVPVICKLKCILNNPARALFADHAKLVADLFTIGCYVKPELHIIHIPCDFKGFLAVSLFRAPADPDIEIFGILTHNNEINILCSLILKRCPDPFKQFNRPQVDIFIKIEPDSKENSFFQDPWLDPVITDRTEIDGFVSRKFFERVFGYQFASFKIMVSTMRIFDPIYVKTELFTSSLKDFSSISYYFRTDTISRDHRDLVMCHIISSH